MKNVIHLSVFFVMLTAMVCITPSSIAATSDCEEVYFSQDDINHERPLLKPHPEFMKSYQLAIDGNAMEQRNIAVSYDAGYLVNACPEKAYDWYQKAAKNGDQIAQDWLARHNKFKAMHDEPEFMTVNKPDSSPAQTTEHAHASSPSSISPNTAKEAAYKCKNVLDGSDYESNKPCPKRLGRSLVDE